MWDYGFQVLMRSIEDYDSSEKTRVSVWEARSVFPIKKRKSRVLKKLMSKWLSGWKANSQYVKVHLNFWDNVVAHGTAVGDGYFIIVNNSLRYYTVHGYPSTTEKAGIS